MRLSTKVVPGGGSGHELFDGLELLEQRLALHQGPRVTALPPMPSLESTNDSVVRILTTVSVRRETVATIRAGRLELVLEDGSGCVDVVPATPRRMSLTRPTRPPCKRT